MIVMGQEEYASHIQAFPKDAAYLNIPIANYVELEIVCGIRHATGEWSKDGNSQASIGNQEIHVGDDEPSPFMNEGADGSIPSEWSDVQAMNDSPATTKKKVSSSFKGAGLKKKSRTSSVDQDIHDCIILMADSIKEVADAINSPKQIRKLASELMLDLKNIPGFSEEEIDLIYDILSKNPTQISTFLEKPTDSKVRWMRKELRD